MIRSANIKVIKKCAFCKYWYDPANNAISPKAPKINLWEYDATCTKRCLQRNHEMNAGAVCGKYVCKLDIL